MNRHPLSVIDVPWACPGRASLLAWVFAPQLDCLIRFPRLCPLMGWAGWHDGCDGQDYQRGVSPRPAWGAPDDGFDQSLQGCVGGGQGVRRESLIEAVNHSRLQDRGCVSAQRCTGVITIPSHLASRYMRLFTTTDLTWQTLRNLWNCLKMLNLHILSFIHESIEEVLKIQLTDITDP